MITGEDIAYTAEHCGLIGTPYSKLDCQAFVEEVLRRAGYGKVNYRGSNHMWRELVTDRTPVKDNFIYPGSLVFIVRNDGGEVARGYHDDMGNATHVAIAIGGGKVMESTSGGVQYGNVSRFTYSGLIKGVNYDEEEGLGSGASERPTDEERIKKLIAILEDNLEELKGAVYDIYRDT